MSESKQPDEVPRCCGTCKFWSIERFPPDGPHVWGNCTVGLPASCTLDSRMTTDLMCCSVGYQLREYPPK
jgi:hypothetical protein